MQRNFGKALAIMALTSSDGVQASYSWFGGSKEQKTTKHSMIEVENGDAEIGELIYHPNMVDVERQENVNDYKDSLDNEDSAPTEPPQRLVLNKEFQQDLTQQALKLNEDFLQQSQFQFAEYLGLTMIQLIFDRNLESADFLAIFDSDENY